MVILASQSPRRKELLGMLNIPFEVRVPACEETLDPGLSHSDMVQEISARKARAAAKHCGKDDIIVAADTLVSLEGKLLAKPRNENEAFVMLSMLSAHTHKVYTGVTVLRGDHCETSVQMTRVTFKRLTRREIDAYIKTGIPMDKAGAYGIQDRGALFVERLDGDYFNVMGLPLCLLGRMLTDAGYVLW